MNTQNLNGWKKTYQVAPQNKGLDKYHRSLAPIEVADEQSMVSTRWSKKKQDHEKLI